MYCHISKSKELQMSLSLFQNILLLILNKWKKLQDGYILRLLHICFMQHICIWWKSVSWIFGGTTDKMHINGVHKRRSDENMSVHFRSFYGATVKMLGNAKCQPKWPSSLNSPSPPPCLSDKYEVCPPFKTNQSVGILALGETRLFCGLHSSRLCHFHSTTLNQRHAGNKHGDAWWLTKFAAPYSMLDIDV